MKIHGQPSHTDITQLEEELVQIAVVIRIYLFFCRIRKLRGSLFYIKSDISRVAGAALLAGAGAVFLVRL